jgi:hypothetical protein
MKKYILALVTLLVAVVMPASIVLAAPSLVVFGNPNPSDTSIVLNWAVAAGSTSTVIRYRTDTYPSSPVDGTSAYSGSGFQVTVSGLTAGQSYYFSAWGYDGVNYSATPALLVSTTLATALPSGGTTTPSNPIPVPTVPAGASSNASMAGFNLEPFTSIIAYFDTAPQGGLGMPINNAWQTIYTLVITFIGLWVYRSNKNFFVAYFVVFILTCFGIGMHLEQWYLAPIELSVGVGVWGLERFFQ